MHLGFVLLSSDSVLLLSSQTVLLWYLEIIFSSIQKSGYIPSILSSILPITRQKYLFKRSWQALRVFNIDSPKTSLKQIYPSVSPEEPLALFFYTFGIAIFLHFLPKILKNFHSQIFALLLDKIVRALRSLLKEQFGIFSPKTSAFFVWWSPSSDLPVG